MKMKRPSIEEVKEQGAKIALPEIECEKFFAYHESRGWVVGKSPMKSWKAAMQTWKFNVQQWAETAQSTATQQQRKTNDDKDGLPKLKPFNPDDYKLEG